MNILEEIAAKTRVRVAENQQKITLAQMKEQAQALNADTGFPMEQALKAEGISFICEVKKASPSKGLIAEDFPYREIAADYEEGGPGKIALIGVSVEEEDEYGNTVSKKIGRASCRERV